MRATNYGSSPLGVCVNGLGDRMHFGRSDSNNSHSTFPLALSNMPVIEPNSAGELDDDTQSSESSSNSLSHCHANDVDDERRNHKARRTLVIASCLCLAFMLAEVVGGYIAGSLAIMTDAAHLLTDFASFLISLFSLYVASRPATRRMSFGWHRAEVLGAFVSVLLIWIITGVLVYMAIERIIYKTYDVRPTPMLITAAVGVFVNVLLGMLLHQSGHHHGHSHGGKASSTFPRPSNSTVTSTNKLSFDSVPTIGNQNGHRKNSRRHHRTSRDNDDSLLLDDDNADDNVDVERGNMDVFLNDGHKTVQEQERKHVVQNLKVRAAFIHVLGNFFQSIGVLIAAYVIYYHPELVIIDPICTFIFSVLVLLTTLAIMRDALQVLMEGSPRGIEFLQVADSLSRIRGVMRVHNLRIWSLTMDKVALSVHLAVDSQSADAQRVLKAATQILRRQFGVFECTVQIEHYSDDMDDCVKCEHPRR